MHKHLKMAAENEDDFLKGETLELIYNLMDDTLDSFFENDIDVVVKEVGSQFDFAFTVYFF